MGYWGVVLNVLKNSDYIVLVIDSRIPEISRNKEIIEKTEKLNKRVILVYNKIDLIQKKDLEKLKKENEDSFFISSKNKTGIKELKEFLINKAENWNRDSLRVSFVGYPNVGKSSLINLLVPKAKLKVSKISGTTKKTEWIRLGKIRIMDSPGVIPITDKKIEIGITSSKDAHKIKEPEKVALKIINFLNKKNKKILENFYNVLNKGDDYDTFLEIGNKKGFLLKGKEVDEHRTAIKIIQDWQEGKISLK